MFSTEALWAEESVLLGRLDKLVRFMNEAGVDLCWMSDPVVHRYLLDIEGLVKHPASLFITKEGKAVYVVGESDKPKKLPAFVDVKLYPTYNMNVWADPLKNAAELIADTVSSMEAGKIATDAYPTVWSDPLSRKFAGAEWGDARSCLNGMRLLKEPYEIARIRAGAAVNGVSYHTLRECAQEGMSEYDLFAAMTDQAIRKTQQIVQFAGMSDLVTGERTHSIGGPPTSRIVRNGDLMMADLFPTILGYHADNCRTICIGGRPTELQQKAHGVVMKALEQVEKLLKPGASAKQLFHTANEILQSIGHGYSLVHHLGHGVGVSDKEGPYLVPGSEDMLQEGMVVSVEPGIYIEHFGIRIENVYVIREGGPENLTPFDTNL
ncbi:Xaa-Pro peptidase family protein [Paenibacillus sp. J2TS4]|uniref:M24 family metallopeptidase n=1 Tax=Paenibacillus sp. J2TS4 TaxID=2807194 RepID=UPI001BCBAD44|nr:Xaa-Pro peptidase family protein [Paenibacillus sp. J2TS4]